MNPRRTAWLVAFKWGYFCRIRDLREEELPPSEPVPLLGSASNTEVEGHKRRPQA